MQKVTILLCLELLISEIAEDVLAVVDVLIDEIGVCPGQFVFDYD